MEMIDGVVITPLGQFCDERGKVMKMLSRHDAVFRDFGEIYFSSVYPGAIKAWHIHRRMTLNYAVPHGQIKFVLYDDRDGSPTKGEIQEVFLGPDNYSLVTVPTMVWNGFKGIGRESALVANCATIAHDPAELDRRDPFDPAIPYDWSIKHG
jgi:dTDP-4-dehydrorhamnose 3,5-epimerase